MNTLNIKEAKWWNTLENGKVICMLCPRYCELKDSQAGFCFIRQNIGGKLYSIGYGRPTGFSVDPIEKKPLNHFLPNTSILSFGTAGCNLACKFCQNWSISKAKLDDSNSLNATPEDVLKLAKRYNTPSIAYTYNDPTIFGEYVIDISRLAREEEIKNVMVTAGYITKEARKEVYKFIDAANVDLKGITERFYFKNTLSHIEPVLDTIIWLKNETDVWIELTTLIIPDENDDDDQIKQLSEWILVNLGDSVPLHFTAFHPDFKMLNKQRTPHSTLLRAKTIASSVGIKYVYLGNVLDNKNQSTFCENCNSLLIERSWHKVTFHKFEYGKCKKCNHSVPGVFN